MITVSILINGQPILSRSATNTGDHTPKGESIYRLDTGELVKHFRQDGPVELAHKLLNTINDDGVTMRTPTPGSEGGGGEPTRAPILCDACHKEAYGDAASEFVTVRREIVKAVLKTPGIYIGTANELKTALKASE